MADSTPGPWALRADPFEDGKPHFWIRAGAGYYGDGAHGFEASGIMSDADAHLIAAAPDLLAALRTAIELFENDDECNRPGTDGYTWLIAARAAIAKAEAA